ncbi:MAG: hypothetical protein ACLU6W_12665 [Lachnospiraceae bacterium]
MNNLSISNLSENTIEIGYEYTKSTSKIQLPGKSGNGTIKENENRRKKTYGRLCMGGRTAEMAG